VTPQHFACAQIAPKRPSNCGRVVSVRATMLRENGFEPDDMPDEDEIKLYFLRKIASGSATPEASGGCS